jgi:serine/threonine protein kinase
MITPADNQEYEEIQNETSIMKLCRQEDNIIQCYDAFDYDGKLWIYMELMDIGGMTDIILENAGKIEEEVCQYILR